MGIFDNNSLANMGGSALAGATPWGAIGQGVGSIVNTIGQAIMNRRQRKWQEEQSELAYNRELEHWNRMNAYNTPAEQMKRFEEAGLNPHLIYGKGTPGNTSQMAKYNAPKGQFDYHPFELPDILSKYQDVKMKDVSIDNLAKQGKFIQAQTQGKELANKMLGLDLGFRPTQISYQTEEMDYKRSTWEHSLDKLIQEAGTAELNKLWKDLKYQTWNDKKYNIDNVRVWEMGIKELISASSGTRIYQALKFLAKQWMDEQMSIPSWMNPPWKQ